MLPERSTVGNVKKKIEISRMIIMIITNNKNNNSDDNKSPDKNYPNSIEAIMGVFMEQAEKITLEDLQNSLQKN